MKLRSHRESTITTVPTVPQVESYSSLFVKVCHYLAYVTYCILVLIKDCIAQTFAVQYHWYRCYDKSYVTANLRTIISPRLFYGDKKTIQTAYMGSKFSWKEKQKLIDSVMRNEDIGDFVFRVSDNGYQQVVDGNSRLIVLYEYLIDRIAWSGRRFSELTGAERIAFMEYKIRIHLRQFIHFHP